MKENNDMKISLRRNRRARGVKVKPDGTEVIFNNSPKKQDASEVTAAGAKAGRKKREEEAQQKAAAQMEFCYADDLHTEFWMRSRMEQQPECDHYQWRAGVLSKR